MPEPDYRSPLQGSLLLISSELKKKVMGDETGLESVWQMLPFLYIPRLLETESL